MITKRILLTFIFLNTIVYSEELNNSIIVKKMYYDNIDTKNQEESQRKINLTYSFGIEILQETINNIQKKANLDKKSLLDECNESLYLAIFDKTIVDKLGRKDSYKRFMSDCTSIVDKM